MYHLDNVSVCVSVWPSHLAAIKAPKIMVYTEILTAVEEVFLWGGNGLQLVKHLICK